MLSMRDLDVRTLPKGMYEYSLVFGYNILKTSTVPPSSIQSDKFFECERFGILFVKKRSLFPILGLSLGGEMSEIALRSPPQA